MRSAAWHSTLADWKSWEPQLNPCQATTPGSLPGVVGIRLKPVGFESVIAKSVESPILKRNNCSGLSSAVGCVALVSSPTICHKISALTTCPCHSLKEGLGCMCVPAQHHQWCAQTSNLKATSCACFQRSCQSLRLGRGQCAAIPPVARHTAVAALPRQPHTPACLQLSNLPCACDDIQNPVTSKSGKLCACVSMGERRVSQPPPPWVCMAAVLAPARCQDLLLNPPGRVRRWVVVSATHGLTVGGTRSCAAAFTDPHT